MKYIFDYLMNTLASQVIWYQSKLNMEKQHLVKRHLVLTLTA